jgi:hypothetical protein
LADRARMGGCASPGAPARSRPTRAANSAGCSHRPHGRHSMVVPIRLAASTVCGPAPGPPAIPLVGLINAGLKTVTGAPATRYLAGDKIVVTTFVDDALPQSA